MAIELVQKRDALESKQRELEAVLAECARRTAGGDPYAAIDFQPKLAQLTAERDRMKMDYQDVLLAVQAESNARRSNVALTIAIVAALFSAASAASAWYGVLSHRQSSPQMPVVAQPSAQGAPPAPAVPPGH